MHRFFFKKILIYSNKIQTNKKQIKLNQWNDVEDADQYDSAWMQRFLQRWTLLQTELMQRRLADDEHRWSWTSTSHEDT